MTSSNQILLSSVSLEELKTIIDESISSALNLVDKGEKEEEILTQNEAAKFLKCTVAHLINLRNKGALTCAFLGRQPRYKKSSLIDYLSK